MKLLGVVLLVVVCAACDKKSTDAPTGKAKVGTATAGGSGSAVSATAGSGQGPGSAATAYDPWAGLPPGADTKLGAKCGDKLNKIDPWDGGRPKDDKKVDVATLEKPAADKVPLKDFGGVGASGFKVTYNPSTHKNHEEYRSLF